MRQETRRALDRLILVDRLKKAGAVVAGIVLLIAAAIIVGRQSAPAQDSLVRETHLHGTIEQWYFQQVKNAQGRQVLNLRVRLDDGREIQAGSTHHHAAKVGDRIDITERIYASGRTAHIWE